MAIGSCSAIKMNQWLGSGAARAYGDEAHQSPPEWAGHLAIKVAVSP